MNIRKIHCDTIERCYCASHIELDGQLHALFASEDPNSICNSYTGDHFDVKQTIWDNAGGCMSIIPIPNTKNEFLAVQEFYLKVTPSLSKIVWGKYTKESGWKISDVISLPYLHRFDIYNVEGKNYFICATIAEAKNDKEDWSKPGQIYVGELPENPSEGIKLSKLVDDCFKNHGYCKGHYNNHVCGYFASEQGVLRISPPTKVGEKWQVAKIMEGSISEIAFVDIDNDGIEEMMTIEPFHGNCIKIYKLIDGNYQAVFTYPNEIDFAHTLVGTQLNGKNVFVAGVRRVNAELFIVEYNNGNYEVNIIETGVGPANLDIVHRDHDDLIIAANHTKNEAAIYVITK